MNVFEINDKSGREIYLTKERWGHIKKKHPEVEDLEEVGQVLRNPDKIMPNYSDESVQRYYKYFKNKRMPYLLVVVKYLNGSGYIVTAFFDSKIR